MDDLKRALKGQYHAALLMLRGAVAACPEDAWVQGSPHREFWRLAYHTLFYTHFYLQAHMDDFTQWELHRDDAEGDQDTQKADARPYTKREILAYWDIVDEMVDAQVDRLDLTSPESGFSWYKIAKLDHQLLNLRHVQEHAGQLRDRLMESGVDQGWVTIG